jgi:tetratricopeptide (TPR) repeat protein
VLLELSELTAVLERALREGTPEEVAQALPLADVLGAAWERLGEYGDGRTRLDAALAAATRAGLRDELVVARVLRRRARLAMGARLDAEADEDLARAYAIAARHDDESLTLTLLIDRADLTMHRGDWEQAVDVVPELLRRTEATGDPLLQAMGLNRAGWSAFGQGEHTLARQRYERARQLAGLHEDAVVESRTASGLGLLAMLEGDHRTARASWRRALELAEQVHDRTFTLMCLDGIAALLALEGADGAARLDASVSAVRETLGRPREEGLRGLHELVLRHGGDPGEPWSYAEAVAFSRRAVAESS